MRRILKPARLLRGSSLAVGGRGLPPWARSYDHGGVVSRKVQKTTVIQNFLVQGQCLLGTIGTISSHGRGWRQFAAVSWRGSSGGLGPRQAPPLSVFEASMIFSPGCRPAPIERILSPFRTWRVPLSGMRRSQSGVAMHDESRAWALYEDSVLLRFQPVFTAQGQVHEYAVQGRSRASPWQGLAPSAWAPACWPAWRSSTNTSCP